MKHVSTWQPLLASLAILMLTGCPQPSTPIANDPDPSPTPTPPVLGNLRLENDAMPLNSWRVGPPLPHERGGLSAGTFNGLIFAIGGDSEATMDLLDPTAGRWRTYPLPPIGSDHTSRARSFGATATAWNRVFYVGGTDNSVSDILDVFDPSTQHWYNVTNPISYYSRFARVSHALVALDDELLVIGGMKENGENQPMLTLDEVIAYRPAATDNAADIYERPPLPQPRAGLGAARLGEHVYALGGFLSAPATGTAEATGSVLRYHANAWHTTTPSGQALASLNVPRHSFGTAVLDGKLYVVGGIDSEGLELDSVEAYDPATNLWTLKASLPTPRAHLGLTAHDGRLYAIGGFDSAGMPLRSVHIFRP